VLRETCVSELSEAAAGSAAAAGGLLLIGWLPPARRSLAALGGARRAVLGPTRAVETPLLAVDGRNVRAARLCRGRDGGDDGGLVVEAISHGRHSVNVVEVGGHDGGRHGSGQTLQENALKKSAFRLASREKSTEIL